MMEIEGIKPKPKEVEEEFTIWDWFKTWIFYHYGIVYATARMLNNITAAML
jgi:hypothetical protein